MSNQHIADTRRMPVVFIGHGNPMNAIEDNRWSRAFQTLALQLPRPKAYLCISAHWYGRGTALTGNEIPPTIHDFGGFPRELFQVQYPAPGAPELAEKIGKMLNRYEAKITGNWGLDHGSWTLLRYLRPDADVPTLQLSIDQALSAKQYLEIGAAISELRNQEVLILGSGNITHNLYDAGRHFGELESSTPDWAADFDGSIASALDQHDNGYLADITSATEFRQSHPTPDHYIPLLYAAGAADSSDSVSYPITGFDLGSLSMRAVVFDKPR